MCPPASDPGPEYCDVLGLVNLGIFNNVGQLPDLIAKQQRQKQCKTSILMPNWRIRLVAHQAANQDFELMCEANIADICVFVLVIKFPQNRGRNYKESFLIYSSDCQTPQSTRKRKEDVHTYF